MLFRARDVGDAVLGAHVLSRGVDDAIKVEKRVTYYTFGWTPFINCQLCFSRPSSMFIRQHASDKSA